MCISETLAKCSRSYPKSPITDFGIAPARTDPCPPPVEVSSPIPQTRPPHRPPRRPRRREAGGVCHRAPRPPPHPHHSPSHTLPRNSVEKNLKSF